MSNWSAYWRMPSPKQIEKMAREQRPGEPAPAATDDGWWDAVLNDPRAADPSWIPIQQRRLSEIPRHLLRVECRRCFRIVEIQTLDAVRLYGPHAVWKDSARSYSTMAASIEPGGTRRTAVGRVGDGE